MDTKQMELIEAEQQLTGFAHAWEGYDIVSLVQGMGLRLEEWDAIKDDAPWLPEKLRREIDAYFEVRS